MDGHNYATVAAALVSPLSRGNITISSNDMSDAPVINWNALTHPADREMVVAAVKSLLQFWDHMSDITVGEEYYPAREAVATSNDTAMLEFVQRSAQTVWHASSTCKVGRANDIMAVVDTRARVYGTRNLRVVDAAAFPFLTPGLPQSGVYMLAEKIADDIRMGHEQD